MRKFLFVAVALPLLALPLHAAQTGKKKPTPAGAPPPTVTQASVDKANAILHETVALLRETHTPASLAICRSNLMRAMEMNPGSVLFPFYLGRVSEQERKWAEAVRWYDKTVALDPTGQVGIEATLKLDTLRPLVQRMNSLPKGERSLQAQIALRAAGDALQSGKPDVALSRANEALALDDTLYEAPALAAVAQMSGRDFAAARDLLAQSLLHVPAARKAAFAAQIQPLQARCESELQYQALLESARTKSGAKNSDGACADWRAAHALFPQRGRAMLALAGEMAHQNKIREAIAACAPLRVCSDKQVAEQAGLLTAQLDGLVRLRQERARQRVAGRKGIALLSRAPGASGAAELDAAEQEAKILQEADVRAVKIAALKVEMKQALREAGSFAGDAQSQDNLSKQLTATGGNAGIIGGLFGRLSSNDSKRKSENAKGHYEELRNEIIRLGGDPDVDE